jgi:hypothetical protein
LKSSAAVTADGSPSDTKITKVTKIMKTHGVLVIFVTFVFFVPEREPFGFLGV